MAQGKAQGRWERPAGFCWSGAQPHGFGARRVEVERLYQSRTRFSHARDLTPWILTGFKLGPWSQESQSEGQPVHWWLSPQSDICF